MSARLRRRFALWLCILLCAAGWSAPAAAAEKTDGLTVYHLGYEDGRRLTLRDDAGRDYPASAGQLTVKRAKKRADALPEAYSSVDAGLVTPVRDQLNTGICWAFAALGALETSAVRQGLADRSIDLSEGHLANVAINTLSLDRTDPTYGDGRSCSAEEIYNGGGNAAIAADALARGAGAATESHFPSGVYLDYRIVMGAQNRYVSDLRLGDFSILDYGADTTLEDVKRAILTYGSVTAGFYNTVSSFSRENGGPACYYYPLCRAADHDVLIVGWDDHFAKEHFKPLCRPASDGAFLCKNSWGTRDARLDDGYFWLSYADASLDMFCTLEALSADAYTQTYQYDGCGWSELITGDGLRAANVFTADREGYLNRLGLYCMPGSTIRYQIYKDPAVPGAPDSGKLVSSGSVSSDRFGYRCAPLSRIVHVEPGQVFSLVVEAVGSEGGFVTAEGLENTYASPGQSYLFDGETWTDMAGTFNNFAAKVMLEPSARHTHVYQTWIETATCTRESRTLRLCEGCDLEEIMKVDPALGHDWADPVSDGDDTHTSVCRRDPSHVQTVPHNWVKTQILQAPTCAEAGLSIYTCFACSSTKRQTEAPLPHTPVISPGYAPTCTSDGRTDATVCAVCEQVLTPGTVLPSPGHDWDVWRDDPDGGGHKRVCKTDPAHIETQAHDWQTLEIRRAPTCAAEGARVVICAVCGRYDLRAIDALGHVFSAEQIEKEPTLTQTGIARSFCLRCGQIRDTVLPALTLADQTPGDVDLDGRVTAQDARLALRGSARLTALTFRQSLNASVRRFDGTYNAADARLILRVSARLDVFPQPLYGVMNAENIFTKC